jgi:hypothetical protein
MRLLHVLARELKPAAAVPSTGSNQLSGGELE